MSAWTPKVGDRVRLPGALLGNVVRYDSETQQVGVQWDDDDVPSTECLVDLEPAGLHTPDVTDAAFAAALEASGWAVSSACWDEDKWVVRAWHGEPGSSWVVATEVLLVHALTLAAARRRVLELIDEREALRAPGGTP